MIIQSGLKKYRVDFESDFSFITRLINMDHVFFVIDKLLYQIYYDKLFIKIKKDCLYLLEALEDNKTIEHAIKICEIMTKIESKRNTKLISFGGGIVQDVSGFVANILYRGIHWTFVPTTLLAACDSCIGGKTSLNYKKYKNLLGTFYPPDQIYISSNFFETLSLRDLESGLGEVVKFNIMKGESGLSQIEDKLPNLLAREKKTINEFVKNSLEFKKEYVEKDEFDKGVRVYLNFAHTFGHAYEVVSDYIIPHGTAVAMGMLTADRISLEREWMEEELVCRIEKVLLEIIHIKKEESYTDISAIVQAIRKDKKQTNQNLTAILMKNNMELVIVNDLTLEEITKAVNYVMNVL